MPNQFKYYIRVAMVAVVVITLGVMYLPRNSIAQAGTAMNGYNVAPDFLAYWNAHGGLALNGYPITSERVEVSTTDGKSYPTQWFERARYERHLENPAASRMLLGLLGSEYLKNRSFAPASSQVSSSSVVYFAPTKHTLSDSPAPFKTYWEKNGGLAMFGYPLSEQVKEQSTDGKIYTVQYFERQRFEYHPEQGNPQYRVLLGLLGTELRNRTPKSGNDCDSAVGSRPLPQPTGTAEPTRVPTCTPEPNHTAEPSQTTEPNRTPEPSQTPERCEEGCQTREPTYEATHEPEPTHQPESTHEPDPTDQPEPTHEARP